RRLVAELGNHTIFDQDVPPLERVAGDGVDRAVDHSDRLSLRRGGGLQVLRAGRGSAPETSATGGGERRDQPIHRRASSSSSTPQAPHTEDAGTTPLVSSRVNHHPRGRWPSGVFSARSPGRPRRGRSPSLSPLSSAPSFL